jgi:Domain of unknown function (DUF4082)
LGLGAAVGIVASVSSAQAVTMGFGGSGFFTSGSGDFTLNYIFQVGASNISVSQLGVFDAGQDGLNTAKQVGLWDSGGTLLASTTVPGGTTAALNGFFRMVNITPVSLTAGQTYTVGALMLFADGDNYGFDPSSFTPDPSISFVNDAYNAGSTFTFPNTSSGGIIGYFGGNIGIGAPTAVPFEFSPSLGFALVGLGLGASKLKHFAQKKK